MILSIINLSMKILLIFLTTFFSLTSSSAQKIIGSAMTDGQAVTDDEKKAKFLVVLEQVDDTTFERLDYNFAGPMISMATFRDKDLKTLSGNYADYNTDGNLVTAGQYADNKKDGVWYLYNDTLKAITKYVFHLDSLIATIDLDSLDKESKKIKRDTTGEVEAVYKGGGRKFQKEIASNFKVPDRTASLKKGGTVRIRFVIDTNGKPKDIAVVHSVEFAFDREAMRVIGLMDDWIPASVKGRKVNAYRLQPITINLN
jgi:TonB family protein